LQPEIVLFLEISALLE